MSSTILETARSSHGDIELFERAVVQLMLDEPRTVRKNKQMIIITCCKLLSFIGALDRFLVD